MNIITIPKQAVAKDDLVIVSRREYEDLLHFKARTIREVPMTRQQKLALKRSRKNLTQGKFLTIHELKRKLGIKN